MQFIPKTEDELNPLLQDGTWDFEIIKAEEKLSKTSGKTMLHFVVRVWDEKGISGLVNDYLTLAMEYKIRHFCYSCGLDTTYETGMLQPELCLAKTGKCRGKIEKDKNGQYPDKNVIVDYLLADSKDKATKAAPEFDDDIPF